MKRLTLVLLAAFALPATASIALNSSRSNVVEDADSVKNSGHASERTTTIKGTKSNTSDRNGNIQIAPMDKPTNERSKLNFVRPDGREVNAPSAIGPAQFGTRLKQLETRSKPKSARETQGIGDAVPDTSSITRVEGITERSTTTNNSKSKSYRKSAIDNQNSHEASPGGNIPMGVGQPSSERGVTVKGSKSNGDNRSIGDAVPDGCKPNEFCASGQHFPQPLKK